MFCFSNKRNALLIFEININRAKNKRNCIEKRKEIIKVKQVLRNKEKKYFWLQQDKQDIINFFF